MSNMETKVTIRLPHELVVRLKDAADDAGISVGMYIRLVLSRELGVPLRPHGNTKER